MNFPLSVWETIADNLPQCIPSVRNCGNGILVHDQSVCTITAISYCSNVACTGCHSDVVLRWVSFQDLIE
jgi:hypothetical protein